MYREIISFFNEFTALSALARMLVAVVIGSVIGLERGRHGIAAGFRTHVLVCLGACVTALVGIYGTKVLGFTGDPLRVSAQVISGIGFLGVGSIFIVGKRYIRGLTTAAGLWVTAATGLAAGIGAIEIAVVSAGLIILTMTLMYRIESSSRFEGRHDHYYIELNDPAATNRIIDLLMTQYHMSETSVVSARSKTPGHIGIQAIVRPRLKKGVTRPEITELLNEDCVIIAVKFL